MELKENHIHLWVAPILKQSMSQELQHKYEHLLDPTEKQRYHSISHPEKAQEFLISRGILKKILANYCSREAEHIQLRLGKQGKPELLAAENKNNLRFSISHSGNVLICGIIRDYEIGVDVEDMEKKIDIRKTAERFYSTEENDILKLLSLRERKKYFFNLWTLKESYIKATGAKSSTPLKASSFFIEENSVRVKFHAPLKEKSEDWYFTLLQHGKGHTTAIAVHHGQPGFIPGLEIKHMRSS